MARRTFIGVRVDPEQLARIDAIADRQGTSRSAVVRQAITDYLRKRRDPK
jgi:predicted transcriptional regulator